MSKLYFDKDGFHTTQNEINTRLEVSQQKYEQLMSQLNNPNEVVILDQDKITGQPYIKNLSQDKEYKNQALRRRRIGECFSVINRGQLWYNTLTEEQKQELQIWYQQ